MKFTALMLGSLFLMSASMQAFAQRPDRPERPSRPSDDRPTRPDREDRPERPSRPEPDRPSRPEPDRPSRPEPRPEPRPETRPEPRPERPSIPDRPSRPEPRPEPETRPERPSRPEPETRPDRPSRPEPRPETRPEPRPEPRPDRPTRPETRPEPRPETRPDRPTRPEPRPETRPDRPTRPEPRPETRPDRPTRPEPRPDVGRRPPYRRPVIVDSRPNRPTPRPDVITRRHRPVIVNNQIRVVRYTRPVDYYRVVPRRHIYRRWIFQPVPRYYYPGYRVIDGYPWYIHNHYRYRYSPVETCQYDLVDSDNNTTVRTFGEFGNMSCNLAYDLCANDRDAANSGTYNDERYFCAEHVSDPYVNNDDTVFDSTYDDTVMSEDQMDRIEDYLAVTTDLQAYNDAVSGVLGQCTVWKLRGNRNGCTYRMKVNGTNHPDAAGLVCSAPAQADIIGCNVGTEKENIGCILKNAVQNGHCL